MKDTVEKIAYSTGNSIALLTQLIDTIRPKKYAISYSVEKINQLIFVLKNDEQLNELFSEKVIDLIGKSNQTELFTQIDVLSYKSLLSEFRKRLFNKLLPILSDEDALRGIINKVFRKKTDYIWIEKLPDRLLYELFGTLKIIQPSKLPLDHYIVDELTNDIYILSQVIVSLSIDKNIVKNFTEVLQMDSPFMRLHEQIDDFVIGIDSGNIARSKETDVYKNIVETIIESKHFVYKIRQSKSIHGTSLELTGVLQKINLCLLQVNDLLELLVLNDKNEFNIVLINFTKKLIKQENRKNSIRSFVNDKTSLLAYQITEHTGRIGEHYVTSTVKEYFEMFRDALKGGLVIGVMVILKFIINSLHLPVFQDALLKALNYSLGFIGIQLVHGTVATKQPSMTASSIAHAIEANKANDEIKEIGDFIIKVVRSQFIAVVGNLLMAFPIAFVLSWIWFLISGSHILNLSNAEHKIQDLNPVTTLCIVHAAIAGVMLFFSGALAGIAENANIYDNYSSRIKHHPTLIKILGSSNTIKLGSYVDANIAGLTGNFTLGFFLAFVAFFGSIFGLPLDIQHVTFATGNLGMAMASIGLDVNTYDFMTACLGIIAIGTVNILVSFSLALLVAIKSRGIKLTKTGGVVVYLTKQFFKKPLAFFYPSK